MDDDAGLAMVPIWAPGHPPQELLDYLNATHELQWEGIDHLETASGNTNWSEDETHTNTADKTGEPGRTIKLHQPRFRFRVHVRNNHDLPPLHAAPPVKPKRPTRNGTLSMIPVGIIDDSADHRNARSKGWLIRSGRRAYLRITRRRQRGDYDTWYDKQFVTADGTRAPRGSIWFTQPFLNIGERHFVIEAAHRHRRWYNQARIQYFENLAIWRQEQREWEERVLMNVWGEVEFPVTFPPHTEDYTYAHPPTPTLSHTPAPTPDPSSSSDPSQSPPQSPDPGNTSTSSSERDSSSDDTIDIQPIAILHWLDQIDVDEQEGRPNSIGSDSSSSALSDIGSSLFNNDGSQEAPDRSHRSSDSNHSGSSSSSSSSDSSSSSSSENEDHQNNHDNEGNQGGEPPGNNNLDVDGDSYMEDYPEQLFGFNQDQTTVPPTPDPEYYGRSSPTLTPPRVGLTNDEVFEIFSDNDSESSTVYYSTVEPDEAPTTRPDTSDSGSTCDENSQYLVKPRGLRRSRSSANLRKAYLDSESTAQAPTEQEELDFTGRFLLLPIREGTW
ncbi:MAG: hypothetical protein M1823_006128 [Watsoniomyces obsoletus]|nr:MAG: hypothetical protein M1823_006128 [Watsoniomyces obsoletus]